VETLDTENPAARVDDRGRVAGVAHPAGAGGVLGVGRCAKPATEASRPTVGEAEVRDFKGIMAAKSDGPARP
jgi:hypothetical protein